MRDSGDTALSGRAPLSLNCWCSGARHDGEATRRDSSHAVAGTVSAGAAWELTETDAGRSAGAGAAWEMVAAYSWQGWVRDGCGPCDVVASGGREPRRSRRAGHLPRARP